MMGPLPPKPTTRTPGKWYSSTNKHIRSTERLGGPIAELAEENFFDAQLMATAPELLEVLQEAREQLRQAWACIEHIKEHAPSYEREAAVAVLGDIGDIGMNCDAAIAKASGQVEELETSR